jgi:hypothetical protein
MMPTTKSRRSSKRRKVKDTSDIKLHMTSLQEMLLCYSKEFWQDIKAAVEAGGGRTLTPWEVKPISKAHQVIWSHTIHAAHLVQLQLQGKAHFVDGETPPSGLEEALALLEIEWPCSRDKAKAAYKAAIKTAHPDAGGCEEQTKALNDAWERLERYFDLTELFAVEEVA